MSVAISKIFYPSIFGFGLFYVRRRFKILMSQKSDKFNLSLSSGADRRRRKAAPETSKQLHKKL